MYFGGNDFSFVKKDICCRIWKTRLVVRQQDFPLGKKKVNLTIFWCNRDCELECSPAQNKYDQTNGNRKIPLSC